MGTRMCRVDPMVVDMLTAAGVSWELVHGKKHVKLVVEGKLVNVFPTTLRKHTAGRHLVNARCQVRRRLRELGHDV